MIRSVERFRAEVERLPAVNWRIDDDAPGAASVRVGARPIASVDLRDARVLVSAPADTIAALQRLFPSSRPASCGLVFDLADGRSAWEALAAIRRRVIVERSIPQLRLASP